jgi:methylphosphotriester-DNA--protein-cysteine methyltransferase
VVSCRYSGTSAGTQRDERRGHCRSVGYRDVAYFRQVFKQIVGMAPNAYRAKTRIALALGNQAEVAAA